MEIIRGKIPGAKKVVVYGPEGIGKTTFASRFPDPVYIDTEGSTKDMDVARTPAPSSWQMLLDQVGYFMAHPEQLKTLVIDTADWAEQMCSAAVCAQSHKGGIEDFGYGKGYVYLQEEFGKLLNLLTDLVEQKGINAVLTAHAKMRKFEQPDEMGAYDRWEMKLTKQVAPMVKEWADMVLFANYKTIVVNVDGQGAQKGKNKVQGGKRVMYTTHHSCWDAKNRYGLPEEAAFDYAVIAPIIEQARNTESGTAASAHTGKEEETSAGLQETAGEEAAEPQEKKGKKEAPPVTGIPATNPVPPVLDERIPAALRDLMAVNGVEEWDLQEVVRARGIFTADVPIWEYDRLKPGIVDGLLVAQWPKVYESIRQMKEKMEIPFD